MDRKSHRRLEAQARVMKALAHPTRLFIVQELSRGPRCVCELTAMVGADISTVSRHLALLKGSGIISAERRGKSIFYDLRMPCALNFFSCAGKVIQANATAQKEFAA
jgi:ArsR family transcriptional regulator